MTGTKAKTAAKPASPRRAGARTPEELETLFEDFLLTRDREQLVELFEEGAVLGKGAERPVRGGEEVARMALVRWHGDQTYVADAQRVLQARDIALIVTGVGINVVRRGHDGAWRYAIVFQLVDELKGAPNDPGVDPNPDAETGGRRQG